MDDIGSFYNGSASGGGAPLCQSWDTTQLNAPVDDFNFDSDDMMLPGELLPDNLYALPTKSDPLCSLSNGDVDMMSVGSHHFNHTSGSEILPVDDDDDDDLFGSTDALELIMDQHGKNKEAEMAAAAQPPPPPPQQQPIKKEVVATLQPAATTQIITTNNTKSLPKIITLQGLSSASKGGPMIFKRDPNSSNISIRKFTPVIQRIGGNSATIHKIGAAGTPIVINSAVAGGNVCRINAPQIILNTNQRMNLQQVGGVQHRMITTTTGQNIKLVPNNQKHQIRLAGISGQPQKITIGGKTGQKFSIAPRMQNQQIHIQQRMNVAQKVHITQAGAKINIVRPFTTVAAAAAQHQIQHRVSPNMVYTTMNQTSNIIRGIQPIQQRNQQQQNSVMLISRSNVSQPSHRPPNFIMNNRGTAVMDPRYANMQHMQHFQQKQMLVLPDPHNLPPASCLRISLSNVVARLRVCCHLDLRKIATMSYDVQYKREKQKVVMRMRDPKCTAYMWSSGKIVCTGSTSAANSRRSSKKFVKRLKAIGYEARFTGYKIVNVLAAAKMPYQIDIQKFSGENRGPACSYEPELHCAVSYRELDTGACLKIFSTGSITVTARSVDRAQQAIRNIYPKLKKFYKHDKPLNICDVFDSLSWNNHQQQQQSSPMTTSS